MLCSPFCHPSTQALNVKFHINGQFIQREIDKGILIPSKPCIKYAGNFIPSFNLGREFKVLMISLLLQSIRILMRKFHRQPFHSYQPFYLNFKYGKSFQEFYRISNLLHMIQQDLDVILMEKRKQYPRSKSRVF